MKNIQFVDVLQGARLPILQAGIVYFFRGDEASLCGADQRWQELLRHLRELVGKGVDHQLEAIGDAEL